jgi:hypothetical protein
LGARLDNDVQMGATGSILSASVAFVALSGEAEYGYAWLFASVVTGGFVRRKAAASAVNEDVMAVVQARFWREQPARSPV